MSELVGVEPPGGGGTAVGDLERHRPELRAYCYRMLGSAFEADDAVQETMVRAWQALDRFEGRSSVRTWLYRIATNVCLRMLDGRRRRALPMDLSGPSPGAHPVGGPLEGAAWIGPAPDGWLAASAADPADEVLARETVRLAFVAALQHLPPRQRAALILRDVLGWRAAEVADLLSTTVVSVNSALQRAREAMAARDHGAPPAPPPAPDGDRQRLLARYVEAFERLDVDGLVALLQEDARFTMPPYVFWVRGRGEIRRFLEAQEATCGRARFVAAPGANGSPAVGVYRPAGEGLEPFGVQVVELSGDRIAAIHTFLDPGLFPLFGLPPGLDDDRAAA